MVEEKKTIHSPKVGNFLMCSDLDVSINGSATLFKLPLILDVLRDIMRRRT